MIMALTTATVATWKTIGLIATLAGETLLLGGSVCSAVKKKNDEERSDEEC